MGEILANSTTLLLALLPIYLTLELIADLRLPRLAAGIKQLHPSIHREIGYKETDGAYRDALRTNLVLPFSRSIRSLPLATRLELRAFAAFRIVAIGYFVLAVIALVGGNGR